MQLAFSTYIPGIIGIENLGSVYYFSGLKTVEAYTTRDVSWKCKLHIACYRPLWGSSNFRWWPEAQAYRAASQSCGIYTLNAAAQLCLVLAFLFSHFSCAVIFLASALNKCIETCCYSRKGRRSCDPLTFFWYVILTLAFSTYIAGCRAHNFLF